MFKSNDILRKQTALKVLWLVLSFATFQGLLVFIYLTFGFNIMEKLVSAGRKEIICSHGYHCSVYASRDLCLLVVSE